MADNSDHKLADELGVDLDEQRRIMASIRASANRNNDRNDNDSDVEVVEDRSSAAPTRVISMSQSAAQPAFRGDAIRLEMERFFNNYRGSSSSPAPSLSSFGLPSGFGAPPANMLAPSAPNVVHMSASQLAQMNIPGAIRVSRSMAQSMNINMPSNAAAMYYVPPEVAASMTPPNSVQQGSAPMMQGPPQSLDTSGAMRSSSGARSNVVGLSSLSPSSADDYIVTPDQWVIFRGNTTEKAERFVRRFIPQAPKYQWVSLSARPRGANEPVDEAVDDDLFELPEQHANMEAFFARLQQDESRGGPDLVREIDEMVDNGLITGTGKWMAFKCSEELLVKLFMLTWQRKLGSSIKTCGVDGVTCMYVSWRNRQNVAEVRCRLRQHAGFTKARSAFKPDVYTHLGMFVDLKSRRLPNSRFGDYAGEKDGEVVAVCKCGCTSIKHSKGAMPKQPKKGTKRKRENVS